MKRIVILEQDLLTSARLLMECKEHCDKQIAELETRERKLRDALSYAMDYMDNEQQRYFKTELWPELFSQEEQ